MADPDVNPSLARNPPSSQRALLSGAISGIAVDFMFFPLDTIKTRVQSTQGFIKSGGLKGVYRGVGSVGMGSAPGASAFFLTYENLKEVFPRSIPLLRDSPSLNHMISASGAEFVSCLIRVPTEIVKSRTQTGAYGQGSSSIHSAMSTWKFEGIRGFYRGFGITIGREIPFTSIQFPLYEFLKTQLSRRYLDGRRPSPAQAAVCGMIAGGFGGAVTTPLDVVKTRVMLEAKLTLQTSMPDPTSSTPQPRIRSPSVLSFPPRLMAILREEGASALFRGWIPRTIAISLGGAVFLGIYDWAVNFQRNDTGVEVDR
ncbi:mitochondrial carrier domain-containing protein [Dioszegia hungarica]|uniref:Mitochondrial carrier domain-containing protein n=1 Tax=Dioszegia hungarica TaxID=4972 RepID=A0AA38LXP8_9TREE|nr:mitochondrial carrier domain-containing protein [Dioszegia hungarica]KAI9638923.1 mitochondrial carrier domain-containing protein [Dioszegia hungarica]